MKAKMSMIFLFATCVLLISTQAWSQETLISQNSFYNAGPDGRVDILASHFRSGSTDRFDYALTNVSYNPSGGNGLSVFGIYLPQPVSGLTGIYAFAAGGEWNISGNTQYIQWDNWWMDDGGIRIGETGSFGFLTPNLPDTIWNLGDTIPGGVMNTHTCDDISCQGTPFADGQISGPLAPEPISSILFISGVATLFGFKRKSIFRQA